MQYFATVLYYNITVLKYCSIVLEYCIKLLQLCIAVLYYSTVLQYCVKLLYYIILLCSKKDEDTEIMNNLIVIHYANSFITQVTSFSVKLQIVRVLYAQLTVHRNSVWIRKTN